MTTRIDGVESSPRPVEVEAEVELKSRSTSIALGPLPANQEGTGEASWLLRCVARADVGVGPPFRKEQHATAAEPNVKTTSI